MTPVAIRRPDFLLLATVGVILVLGLDMVYSASYVIAHNDPQYGSDTYFLFQQATRAGMGVFLLLVFQAVDYHVWRRLTVPLIGLVFALLLAVLATHLAHSAYGAQRWLKFGPLPPIEPSELAKLALVLYGADWLDRRQDRIRSFTECTLPFVLIVAALCALVLAQPDLGTTIVIAAIGGCLFFVAGADWRHLALGLVVGGTALVLAIMGAGYRSDRIAAFLDPAKDPLGVGWNITQAQIALGSGGIFGLGLGASRQKFYYLPNAQTDAIFAVVGEELGIIGTIGVILLFGFVAYRGIRIAVRAPDLYGSLICTGVTVWLVLQAFINMGVITATIPFTGIPLPFVSYGGSSLMVSLLAVGIVLNVSRQLEVAE
jgi:cell division protein FtsW